MSDAWAACAAAHAQLTSQLMLVPTVTRTEDACRPAHCVQRVMAAKLQEPGHARAERPRGAAQLMSRRVVVTEERACRLCHARIGTKMSAVFPNGLLVCYKCLRKGDPHVCPVTGVDFRGGLPGTGQRPPPPPPPEEPERGPML